MESESSVHDAGPSCSYQASTTRIFLSHAGAEKGFVEQLYNRLCILYTSGSVFFDKHMLRSVDFVQVISQAVEDCELAIVVMSHDYFRRKWPMIELDAIVKAKKSRQQLKNDSGQSKITPKELHIVPLYYKLTVKKFRDKRERNQWHKAWKKIIKEDKKHFNDETEARWLGLLETLSSTVTGCVNPGTSEEEYIQEIATQVCRLVAPSVPHITTGVTTGVQGLERFEAEFKEKLKCSNPKEPVRFFGMYGICGSGKTTMSKLFCDQVSKIFLWKVCHVETDPQMKWRSKLLDSLFTWSTGKPTTQSDVKGEDKLLQQELPKHRLFLVLDNVQTSGTSVASVDSFLKFKSFKAGSVVLITSSCSHETLLRTFHDIAWTEVFPVPTLQKEEAACLLAKSAGYDLSKLSDKENMYVSKFVERCYLGFKKDDRQYHPRALETLGSYIRRRGRTEWVNWYGICQRGEKEVFCELLGRFNELLGQVFTSSNPTMYFDIILTLPRGDTRVSSRILHTQEDFCEWYAFAFPDATGIPASIEDMERQDLLVIEDCRNYWGMGNLPCHRFLVHDLYREVVTLIAKGENLSNIRSDDQSYHKSRINVQNDAELSNLSKHSDANIMRVVRCSDITKLDLQGLSGLRSLEIRHCPNLRKVCNGQQLYCLLWEGCGVKFPSLMGMASLKLLIIQGDDSNSPSMRRLPKRPGCFGLSKNSIAKMERSNYLKDCALLQVLHLSSLQDLLEFPDLGHLKHLVKLEAAECRKVRSLGGLTNLPSLKHLDLSNLDSLEELPSLGGLTALQELNVAYCPKLREIPTLQNLTKLIHLRLVKLPIEQIPSNKQLVKLEAADCGEVRSLGGLTNWTSLEHLYLSNFDSLEELPGLGGLTALKDLRVTNCPKLREIPTLQNLTNLIHLCLDALPIEQSHGNELLVKRHLRCRHSN